MPNFTLTYGSNRTVFDDLASELFPISQVPVEPRYEIDGGIELKLTRMRNDASVFPDQVGEEEYYVNLTVGPVTCSMGNFRKEENARRRYDVCLKALQSGGRISVGISSPIKIVDSEGKPVLEQSYSSDRFEDAYV